MYPAPVCTAAVFLNLSSSKQTLDLDVTVRILEFQEGFNDSSVGCSTTLLILGL